MYMPDALPRLEDAIEGLNGILSAIYRLSATLDPTVLPTVTSLSRQGLDHLETIRAAHESLGNAVEWR